MDAAKTKKLEEYSSVIEKQAQSAETGGNVAEASALYIKLVDIYLLLASEAPDHPTWSKYISKAEALQKKVKEMNSTPPVPPQLPKPAGGIKKIFGIKPSSSPASSQDERKAAEPIPPRPSPQAVQALPKPVLPTRDPEQMVPKRLYDQLLEKSKQLESRIASMVERQEYEEVESKWRELDEKLSSAPSRAEFDEQRRRLELSVPRSQYEELQRAFINLVPRDILNAAQARITELESQLKRSIPSSVLENLANEISLLILTAAIPIQSELPEREGESHNAGLRTSDARESELVIRRISEELLLMRKQLDKLELKVEEMSLASTNVEDLEV